MATDGPWDLRAFLETERARKRLPEYAWSRRWVNVRAAHHHATRGSGGGAAPARRGGAAKRAPSLKAQLRHYGLEFEGRPHSGIDDSRNIARVAMRLLEDGFALDLNDALDPAEFREPEADADAANEGGHEDGGAPAAASRREEPTIPETKDPGFLVNVR